MGYLLISLWYGNGINEFAKGGFKPGMEKKEQWSNLDV